ncbi:MAG: chaperone NapD [Gammaproteobacteria bacterium]|nr:chaperone NapD [Gammaproteobacteria bacterium]
MNLSGILVLTSPERCSEVVDSLNQTSGVEVHIHEPQGRIIAVQEAATVDDEVAGLRRIKDLPHVVSAELVYHYVGDDSPVQSSGICNIRAENQSPDVPAYLNS